MYKYLLLVGFCTTIFFKTDIFSHKIALKQTKKIPTTENVEVKSFWNSLKALQGKTFEGTLVNAPANDDFAEKKLVMHVLFSDDETILIPFNVGDNLSRTWVFKNKNNRIELKHDHRMKNGENDKITMYGGISTNNGNSNMQVFPADQETQNLIHGAFSNVWWVTLNPTTFTYNLRRIGSDRVFTVSFDLTKEIEKPVPSWGWENYKK
jgi:hypothetical protein